MNLMVVRLAVGCLHVVYLQYAVCTMQYHNASVIVYDSNDKLVAEIFGLQAGFGPLLPGIGIQGHLLHMRPSHGCTGVVSPPWHRPWIALMRRGGCEFSTKVLNAQRQGYIAAIVYNVHSDKLLTMAPGQYGAHVNISSVFIGTSGAYFLFGHFDRTTKYVIHMGKTKRENPKESVLVPLILFLSIFMMVSLIYVIIYVAIQWYQIRQARLPHVNLSNMSIIRFKTGDNYDTCAICLEEFVEDDRLRELPCAHVFHLGCVDPWLTRVKSLCPICKRDVNDEHNPETHTAQATEDNDELTPLLANETFETTYEILESRINSLTPRVSVELDDYGTDVQHRVTKETLSIGTERQDNVTEGSNETNISPDPAVVSELPETSGK